MRKAIYITILAILFSSCHSSRRAVTLPELSRTGDAMNSYVNTYAELAMDEMKRTGVPASITLAQGIIESDYGRSRLAREANNHFGIKCHNGWSGKKIYHDDDRRNECFRKYNDPAQSYRDHSDFLTDGTRYEFLFELKADDYKNWAKGLKQAGYATNPRYARMLIDMIEENNLSAFDQLVLSGKTRIRAKNEPEVAIPERQHIAEDTVTIDKERTISINSPQSRIETRNRIQYIRLKKTDSFQSIIEDFELMDWEIYRYNDLERNATLVPGEILYLQPKRNKAEAGSNYHIVKEGENMYMISQLYGIKLEALYEKNRMEPGTEPEPGTELWLRKTKPEGL